MLGVQLRTTYLIKTKFFVKSTINTKGSIGNNLFN